MLPPLMLLAGLAVVLPQEAQSKDPGDAGVKPTTTLDLDAMASRLPSGGEKTIDPSAWALSLAEARALALRGNLDLRLAEETANQAHFGYLGSFGAFEWRFRAGAGYTDATREVTSSFLSGGNLIESTDESFNLGFERPLRTGGIFDVSFQSGTQETNAAIADDNVQTSDELALSFTQPLLRGRGEAYTTATQQEEEIRWQQEVERWRGQRQTTLAEVDLAYWDLRAALDALEVQRSAVDLGLALLDRRQRELQAGVGTDLAVLESESDLATRREALLSAANLVGQREDALKTLLLGPEDFERWEQPIQPMDTYPLFDPEARPIEWRAALAVALEGRTELRQAQSAIRLAEIGKTRALSERLAGLDLVLRASSNAVDRNFRRAAADTFDWEAPTYTATLNYDIPLGNTQARAAAESADSALRGAWVEWERAQRDVLASVRSAQRDLVFRREALQASTQSLVLAERQLEQEVARNQEGLSTNFQVLEVQQRYVEALSTQRQSRAEWAKARVELLRSQGLMGEEPQGSASE